jgi:FKBP-type peptidyl-prolyl cis-trans isomerase
MVNTKSTQIVLVLLTAATFAACERSTDAPGATSAVATTEEQPIAAESTGAGDAFEIAPGLSGRVLKNGYGRAAEAGDLAEVHYTGWLFDASAADKRGTKFDSSVDRGERFQFPLGAGRVIQGWDQGVLGMLIGEKRELTIAPEMGYGDRGAGNVIPPGATLVFEVELFRLVGPDEAE